MLPLYHGGPVKDDGPGLSESEIDLLFVPFSRLKPGNMKSSNDKVFE